MEPFAPVFLIIFQLTRRVYTPFPLRLRPSPVLEARRVESDHEVVDVEEEAVNASVVDHGAEVHRRSGLVVGLQVHVGRWNGRVDASNP